MLDFDPPKQRTKLAQKVEKWLNELGFQTVMEYQVGKYFIDIFIPELPLYIEVDGFGHWKKRDKKRDGEIYEMTEIKVLRLKPKDMKKEIIEKKIQELFNECGDG